MFEKRYKSPLGYEFRKNGIDSYGVNHNGFSTRVHVDRTGDGVGPLGSNIFQNNQMKSS